MSGRHLVNDASHSIHSPFSSLPPHHHHAQHQHAHAMDSPAMGAPLPPSSSQSHRITPPHAANHNHSLDHLSLSAPQASSLLASAGPPPASGPSIPAGTGPGGTPTTALSVYHLINQLCQRPPPSAASATTMATASTATANGSATPGSTTIGGAAPTPVKDGSESARETALLELSKKREQYEDLALVLWHSFGVMSSLLQEIIAVYPLLSPPALTAHASNRVCNALALLQCVASHHETRALFLQGECRDPRTHIQSIVFFSGRVLI